MKGHVYKRGKTWSYLFDIDPDPLTGKRQQSNGSGYATEREAWKACRTDLQIPGFAMQNYLTWLKSLPGKPVFESYPVAFDFMFTYWYLIRFTGESPCSHSALDIKTIALAMLKKPYRESTKRNMPKRWFDDLPHSHLALDDAIEQGALFCNMLAENLSRTA